MGFFVLLAIIGTIYDLATMNKRTPSKPSLSPVRVVFPEYRIPRPSMTGSQRGQFLEAYQQYDNRAYQHKVELPPASSMPQGFISYPPPDYKERDQGYGQNWAGPPPTEPPVVSNNTEEEPWQPGGQLDQYIFYPVG